MKGIFFLHNNALPHTSLCTYEAVTKMGWTILLYTVHSPDLAPPECHLFDHVKEALHECHFADGNKLKQSSLMCSKVEAGNFIALVYCILPSVGKSSLNILEMTWKNSLLIATDV
jgi:hypothetical protein